MSKVRNFGRLLIAVAFVFALSLPTAQAQNVYGTIPGNVADASGAALPDRTITLTNLATAEKHTQQTSGSGDYTFVNILPGRYRLEGEKGGFRRARRIFAATRSNMIRR